MKTGLFFIILNLIVVSSYAQYLSHSGFDNRIQSNYVYKLQNSTDGLNRNNKQFNSTWVQFMVDWGGDNLGYTLSNAQHTSLFKNGIVDYNAITPNGYYTGPAEWGYSFYHLPGGNGTVLPSTYNSSLTTKQDRYNNLQSWFQSSMAQKWGTSNWNFAVNGHYDLENYAIDFNQSNQYHLDAVGSEVGENIIGTPFEMAASRGAARSASIPWLIDMSPWFGPTIRDYSDFYTDELEPVSQVALAQTTIGAYRTSDSSFFVKSGPTNSNWTLVQQNLKSFSIDQSDIAMMDNSSNLIVKNGVNGSGQTVLMKVTSFQVKNGNLAAIQNDTLKLKSSSNSVTTWNNMAGTYQSFVLSENRLAMLNSCNQLMGADLSAISTSYTISSKVYKYYLTDSCLAFIKQGDSLFYVFSNFSANPSPNFVSDSVQDVKVFGNRIVYKKKDNSLWLVVNGPGTKISLGANVLDFAVDGSRIAKLLNGTNDLYLLTGTNYNYLNTVYTDQGWRFVSENIKQVILEPNSGRMGMLSNQQTANFFIKANGLDQGEGTNNVVWTGNSNVGGGHSNSLTNRMQYFSYMTGANIYTDEACNVTYFLGPNADAKGRYFSLSPVGKLGQSFYNFTHNVMPNRGMPYQPVAVMLEQYHGIGYETFRNSGYPVFSSLTADFNTNTAVSLIKNLWSGVNFGDNGTEDRYLGNSPYGEIFDIVTPNVPQNVLNEYPVVIVTPSSANIDTTKLRNYVLNGGNLVVMGRQRWLADAEVGINYTGYITFNFQNISSYLDGFVSNTSDGNAQNIVTFTPYSSNTNILLKVTNNSGTTINLATSTKCGNGNIIFFAPELFNLNDNVVWSSFISAVATRPEIVPFSFNGDMQYSYTFNGNNQWNITMINNKGVTKTTTPGFETIDETKTTVGQFALQTPGLTISSVKDVTNQFIDFPFSGGVITATLQPGEVKILQVTTSGTPTFATSAVNNTSGAVASTMATTEDNNIKVFPNPVTKNILNIQFKQLDGTETVTLMDMSGGLLFTQKIDNTLSTLNTANYSKGMYLVKIVNKTGTTIKKVVF
ncbi:T9SS type A sorting domain-containing protein [Chitinophagaceae bacterium 26-R-25]|nr:T9SS type A sorting domain-containing protein [Chitinophagaceae bacterium 26-R-25]